MKTLDTRTRIQIKNILFLTDFSRAADAAIPYATEVTKRFGAKLFALHMRTPAINPMTEPATWSALEEAAEAEMKSQREILRKSLLGLDPQILIEEGNLYDTLLDVVEKNKIDLIVLGTQGRSGVAKFFLGSVAEEIFRQAPCPVLTVGPFTSGRPLGEGQIKEIVYATDFSPESAAAAAHAISLAQEFQAHLTLMHVLPSQEPADLPLPCDLPIPGELVKATEQHLRNLVPAEAELWCEPRFVVEQGSPAGKILQVAKDRDADLIVLGIHKPGGFLGAATHLPIATAHKVVSHAPCPVLTVRGAAVEARRNSAGA
jgi:nucleotide-binding universal stress UspA family protein